MKRRFLFLLSASLTLSAASTIWAQSTASAPPSVPVKTPANEKFHLYLLIGQSNMAGRGVLTPENVISTERVLKFSKEKTWVEATEPLHFDKPIAGAGLGASFALEMVAQDPGITIGLIPCAVGGTPLSRWVKGGDLYAQALERAKLAMQDGTIKGILWHQGEADGGSETTARSYAERLAGMVKDLRADLGSGDVPFVAGKLGLFRKPENKEGKPSFWPIVNEQIAMLPSLVPACAVVDAESLTDKGDHVHFDTASLREFGKRYAEAMKKLVKP